MGVTVLIVDDHAAFRASARRVLEAAGYDVVGEAADGATALTAVRDLRPAVVLLDVHLPDTDGFEVSSCLCGAEGAPAVVLTSSHDDSDYGSLVVGCGARGFVPKDELSGELLERVLS